MATVPTEQEVPAAQPSEVSATRALVLRAVGQIGGGDWRRYVMYIAFVLVLVVFAIFLADRGFLTSRNLLNIVAQSAIIGVMAVAMTFVIGAAQIDLSVGSVAGLSSVAAGLAIRDYGLVAGVAAGLAVGLAVGAFNGVMTTRVRIPSFLVTLAMLGIANGIARWITDTAPVPIREDLWSTLFGRGRIGELPSLAIWVLVFMLVGHVVLRKTAFGREVLATGGNETSARFSGVNTRATTMRVLVLSSVVAAVAGMLYSGRLASGRFDWGAGDELSVIAAVILGGTSLFGGYASVVGSVMGALMIGLINNGLTLWGLEAHQQQIVQGAIIILAVALQRR
jgi:ribose transport system permease protein